MTITEIIRMLEGIRAENGDLQVVTDEYAGGGYDLYVCTPRVVQDEKRSTAPVVIIDGEEPFSANIVHEPQAP